MLLAKIENNKIVTYPVTNLLSLFPNTSFSYPLTEDQLPQGIVKVEETNKVDNPDEFNYNVIEDTPEVINGILKQKWLIVEKSTEEKESYLQECILQARAKRNFLLKESDWTQTEDAPVDKAAWKTYRQALRDITTQPNFPYSIDWPIEP